MLSSRRFLPAAAAAFSLASCGSPTEPNPSPARIEALPRALSVEETEVLDASNDFAFRLLDEVRADGEPQTNVFVSPLSVSIALGMAANGASGETLDAIKDVLGTENLGRDGMNDAYLGLSDLLFSLDPAVELGIANSAWIKEGFPARQSFVDRLRTYFDAEVREVDFGDPSTKDLVNAWVSDETEGRIEEILEVVKPEDVLYLLNAIYFKGEWRSRFDRGATRTAPFHLEDGGTTEVPLMAADSVGGLYYHGDGVSVADLPYGGEAFSMVLVLPTSGTLTDLLETLDRQRWDSWMAGLEENGYRIELPRFELEYEADLEPPLARMGMEVAFDASADFTDLSEEPTFIDRVKHKTFLKVDEEGTEAAAVTFIGVSVVCGGCAPSYVFDRPFLVAIRERLSGTVLFLGAIYDPS